MRATVMFGAGDVRIEDVPDSSIQQPTDAIIRVTRACICGSDLWPYNLGPAPGGQGMGHEAIGIVEDVGSKVKTLKRGQVVIMPFASSDGTCMFCEEGLPTACVHIGFFGNGGDMEGAQAEALRIPQADGTLFPLPVREDDALMPSLLTLSDVMGTGHHAAVTARVARGHSVAVVGDGAVGLCGVIAAKRLGAEQIIIMGRHADRIALARDFGATDVVSERGEEAVERVRELTRRIWRSFRAGVRRDRTGDRDLDGDRSARGCRRPRRRASLSDRSRRRADVLQERECGRRTRSHPHIHLGAVAGCDGRSNRAWARVRPHRASRRGA